MGRIARLMLYYRGERVSFIHAFTLSSPSFSVNFTDSGNKCEIDISNPDPTCIYVYTLDGSEPTENSLVWNGPLVFDDATTIKMMAIRGLERSVVVTYYLGKVETPEIYDDQRVRLPKMYRITRTGEEIPLDSDNVEVQYPSETITSATNEVESGGYVGDTNWACSETSTLTLDRSIFKENELVTENDTSVNLRDKYWSVELSINGVKYDNTWVCYWHDDNDVSKTYLAFYCVNSDGGYVWVNFGRRIGYKFGDATLYVFDDKSIMLLASDKTLDLTSNLNLKLTRLY